MKRILPTLTALTLAYAAAAVVACGVSAPHGPVEGQSHTANAAFAPTYPHNINPDPHGPLYTNPYDPGEPDDVAPAVIGPEHLPPVPDED
jgi:hypothetical protein